MTHTSSLAANSTFTVSEEAAINELMDNNNDAGEYVLMSSKEDVDDLSAVRRVVCSLIQRKHSITPRGGIYL